MLLLQTPTWKYHSPVIWEPLFKIFTPAPTMVGPIVDTEWGRMSNTLQIFDTHAWPPVPIVIGNDRAAYSPGRFKEI